MKKLLFIIIFILLLVGGGLYFVNKRKIEIKTLPKNLENKTSSLIKKEESSLKTVSQNVSQDLDLEIIEPQNNITVNNPNLKIKGKTNPHVEVFINEKELFSDEQGNFEAVLILDEGENIITVIVSDSQGNYVEKELIVTLETVD